MSPLVNQGASNRCFYPPSRQPAQCFIGYGNILSTIICLLFSYGAGHGGLGYMKSEVITVAGQSPPPTISTIPFCH